MGPVAQPVFKTGEVWQPQAGSVRLRGRSVFLQPTAVSGTTVGGFPERLRYFTHNWSSRMPYCRLYWKLPTRSETKSACLVL